MCGSWLLKLYLFISLDPSQTESIGTPIKAEDVETMLENVPGDIHGNKTFFFKYYFS